MTPLHLAVRAGNLEITRLLLEHGADMDAKTDDDIAPLHLAVRGAGNLKISRLLLERGASVDAKTDDNTTPLHLASGAGNLEITQLLLDRGADMEAQMDDDMMTPLLLATQYDHLDVVRLLLDRGAAVDSKDVNDGWTPLHWIAFIVNMSMFTQGMGGSHLEVARLLLERGAAVDAKAKARALFCLFAARALWSHACCKVALSCARALVRNTVVTSRAPLALAYRAAERRWT